MKKSLILITSYCNTKEKKVVLLNLLKDLEKFRENFDILLATHTFVDNLFYDYVDYIFYDKKNTILTDIEYRQNSWFQPFDNYVIWSSYIENGNTLAAIWDMIVPSISIAKSQQYEKIHYIEYDSRVFSNEELLENEKLLDNYDYIVYGSENTHKMIGSLLSFRTDSIIKEWELPSHLIFEKLFFGVYPKTPENIVFNLIAESRRYLKKNNEILSKKGIETAIVRGSKYYWDVPYYDPQDGKLKFLSYNNNKGEHNIKVIVNNNKFFHIDKLDSDNWRILDLLNNFDDVETIVVFRNNVQSLYINLTSQESKEKFILYNSALTNSSIDPSIVI
jgi:hypothetical protein